MSHSSFHDNSSNLNIPAGKITIVLHENSKSTAFHDLQNVTHQLQFVYTQSQ